MKNIPQQLYSSHWMSGGRNQTLQSISFCTMLAILPLPLSADEWDISGAIGGELSYFPENGNYVGQLNGAQPSLILEPELRWEAENGDTQLAFLPFLRLDARDEERTHGDVREAYLRHVEGDWELVAGVNRVFWGVTESRHLVNIINQIDTVENTDEEDFLGQPMININYQADIGRFGLFLLPGFRERTFPGVNGRLRGPFVVDTNNALYGPDADEWHTDIAARYSHYFGNWDVGASYFYGVGREPTLIANSNGTAFLPRYDIIHQVGLDLQYTKDAWLWKFEGIIREGHGNTFPAFVGGFEYTFYQISETNADLGILSEYLYDARDTIGAPVTIAQNDFFIGTRLTLNDIDDTAALLGSVIDVEDGSSSLRLEAEKRIGNQWKIELESQWLVGIDNQNAIAAFASDDFVLARLTWYY